MAKPVTLLLLALLSVSCRGTAASQTLDADANLGAGADAGAPNLNNVTIANFHDVDGRLFRGARPTATQMAELQALGVKTIVSLETYEFEPWDGYDEEQGAAAAGIQFLRVPMNPLPVPQPTVEQVTSAVQLLADPSNQPAFVHCYHGSDRTGITVGAYRILVDNWTPDAAITEVEAIGHSSIFYKPWDEILNHVGQPGSLAP